MSSRFHNKYHRHNHHTTAVIDPRYPDASHDPIASHDSPFQGDFILNGILSADNLAFTNASVTPGGTLTSSVSSLNINVNGQSFKIPLLV
jgi:hypothetical protein